MLIFKSCLCLLSSDFFFSLHWLLLLMMFFFAACCKSSDMHFWSDSSCQISCVWVRTVSVLHSDTNWVTKWMSLSLALRLKLHNKCQTLFADICSECLSFWLQIFWKTSFCSSVFLTILNVKWLLHKLMLIWQLHCRFDMCWQRWCFKWKLWCRNDSY